MNPVLIEIYSTIIPSAPYLIGAYALLWAAVLTYGFIIISKLKKAEAQMSVLEEALNDKLGAKKEDGEPRWNDEKLSAGKVVSE